MYYNVYILIDDRVRILRIRGVNFKKLKTTTYFYDQDGDVTGFVENSNIIAVIYNDDDLGEEK